MGLLGLLGLLGSTMGSQALPEALLYADLLLTGACLVLEVRLHNCCSAMLLFLWWWV